MKRFDVRIHTWSESWSESDFSELQVNENKKGEWVKATDALKLQHRIERMQKRLDILEGRVFE